MTTEESRESLDRAVEEARRVVVDRHVDYVVGDWSDHGIERGRDDFREWEQLVDALIAAVSAKARAEERERYENDLITTWANLKRENQLRARNLLAARFSEEAGNG